MEDRIIDKKYLVVSEKGPLTMADNKKKAMTIFKVAEQKGLKVKFREVFLPQERMNNLGFNLFKRSLPCPREEIQNFRNKLIVEFHSFSPTQETAPAVWKRVSRKYNIEESLEQFNQYCIDIIEYYNWE